jgi:branched-chain amino acid transport system substrate-binding protein
VLRGLVVGDSTQYVSTDPAWLALAKAYSTHFPGLGKPQSPAQYPLVLGFHTSVEAVLRALDQAGTDGPAFMRALAVTKFDSPTGPVRLDRNRQAVVSAYLSKVEVAAN